MHYLLSLSSLALCSASALAQTASFTTLGQPCASAITTRTVGSNTVRLSGTLPILGHTYTVTTRGPAGKVGVLMWSTSVDFGGQQRTTSSLDCRQYLTGTVLSVPIVLDATGTTRTVMQASASATPGTILYFQARVSVPGANAAGVLLSEVGAARLGLEPDLTPGEIAQFAPVVRIHPAESYRPMSPDEFIARSRFRHHRGWQSDQGFHRERLEWVTTDSHDPAYYGIPVNWLNAYQLHANGQNRRPRDSNCGDSYNVFLQSAGRLTGPTAPTGVVPAYYFYRRIGAEHRIQYWWFCGFNDSFATFNHQGDWEHVTVHVKDRAIIGVHFAAHEGGTFVARNAGLRFTGTRPLVYMAKGSHASYHTTGTYMAGVDVASDGGPQWDTSVVLRSLDSQPWRDYAGAWGEVGAIGTTTGPLGPWHKRFGS
ncbi:MAG: Vps62-related protein [Planctomycetes bacterium]|nr:Vps62-related protein [Planctomycetota bacterium]